LFIDVVGVSIFILFSGDNFDFNVIVGASFGTGGSRGVGVARAQVPDVISVSCGGSSQGGQCQVKLIFRFLLGRFSWGKDWRCG
jgi:hypothetical protein